MWEWEQIVALVSLAVAIASPFATLKVMEAKQARTDEDIKELKLSKASTESVSGVTTLLQSMRADMDRRFDRLEEGVLKTLTVALTRGTGDE